MGLLVRDRSHQQQPAGPGGGDVEQPPLLDELLEQQAAADRRPLGEQVHQQVDAEQRATPTQVRPAALLHPGHADHLPLQALAGVRGEDVDLIADVALLADLGIGDLQLADPLVQLLGIASRIAFGQLGGLGEQCQHRVQRPVGAGGIGTRAIAGAGVQAAPVQPPGQPGRLPDRPEHVLRTATGGHRRLAGLDHRPQPLGRRPDGFRQPGQRGRFGDQLGEGERFRRPAQVPAHPQHLQRVGSADRADQQRLGIGDGDRLRLGDAAQQIQQ